MKVELSHPLENVAGLFSMSFWIRGGNEEVIHIDDEPSFSDHVSEQVVHESLECGRGVAEAEKHDHWFKEFLVRDESSLLLMAIFDTDVVVTPMNIKLGKVVSIFQLVHEVGDEGKGVCVSDSMFI